MRRRTKSTERQQEQEEDFAGVAADHSATRKFSSLSGPIVLFALSFPCRSTNAITDPHAGQESGDYVAPVGLTDKIIRGAAGDPPRVARSTPIHRAKTSSVTAVKVKVKSSLRQGPGGWEIVVRSQGHGSGAGYGLLCSYGLQCSHGHGGFRPVVRGTFEQFKTRLLRVVGRERPEGEGSVRRAVHRAVRGACFALAPQYGPP